MLIVDNFVLLMQVKIIFYFYFIMKKLYAFSLAQKIENIYNISA